MLHLLHIEWLKVKNYRTFWILLLLIVVSIPAVNYMVFDLTDNAFPKSAKQMQTILLGRPFSFPLVWQTTGWLSSLMLFIPALLIITLTTNEFTYKTHRQNIIDGLSRVQFVSVKIFEVFLLALLSTLLVFLSALWIGHIATEPGNPGKQFENMHQLGYFFVEAISYIMLSFLLSILIKRAALVIGLFFLYSVILEQIIVQLLKRFANIAGDYLPLETCDRLIPNPFLRIFNNPALIATWQSRLPYYLTMAGVYLIIYCAISTWYVKEKDL